MQKTTYPNITIRRSEDRGHVNHDWLDAKHSFSFGDYYDPAHMNYRTLRVINEDQIAPGKGFGMHPHSSMEIFTYLISGELEHKDSMGNGRTIKSGEFQYMSAGSGVMHSERNPSPTETAHLLQIWITPDQPGGEPAYADMNANALKKENALTLLASGNGHDGSIPIRQNAEIYFGQLHAGAMMKEPSNRRLPHLWIQMIQGEIQVAGETIKAGDSLSIEHTNLEIKALHNSEFLLFKLS